MSSTSVAGMKKMEDSLQALNTHIHCYLKDQKKLLKTAALFFKEARLTPDSTLDIGPAAPHEFLEKWWSAVSRFPTNNKEETRDGNDLLLASLQISPIADMFNADSKFVEEQVSYSLDMHILYHRRKSEFLEAAVSFANDVDMVLIDVHDSKNDDKGVLPQYWLEFTPFFSYVQPMFPKKRIESEKLCVICGGMFDGNQRLGLVLPKPSGTVVALHCTHQFHEDCIAHWLRIRSRRIDKTCPTCRELCFYEELEGLRDTCTICLRPIEFNYFDRLGCKHTFHSHCLKHIEGTAGKFCPICGVGHN